MAEADQAGDRRGGVRVTPEQAAIIDHVRSRRSALADRLTVVDAGAGSGKTYTTVAAVLQLLDDDPAATSVDQFVLITFTRKAADELRRRIEAALLGRRAAAATPAERRRWADARERLAGAYVGTIHGFCRQVLRAFGHGAMVAREADVSLGGGGMLYEAISDVFEEQGRTPGRHPLLAEMGRAFQAYHLEALVRDVYQDVRNRGLDPAAVAAATAAQPDDSGRAARVAAADLVARVHATYDRKKRDADRLDAADLLAKTAEVLTAAADHEPPILDKLAARHRWLFVDEFQDTDKVQERVVELLLPRLAGVLLVGDVKQSIYRFRGAGLELATIAARHRVPLLPLSVSRRPTDRLLAAQNALFASVGRNHPDLHSPLELPDDPVHATTGLVMAYADAGSTATADGARATAHVIAGLVDRAVPIDVAPGRTRPLVAGDIAVLFRTNRAVAAYEAAVGERLAGRGIVVRREEGGQFFRRPEVVAAYRLVRLVLDYPNEVALSQALRTPYLAGRAHPAAAEQGVLQDGPLGGDLAGWFANAHRDLEAVVRDLQAAVRTDTVPQLLEQVYRRFGLREHHRDRGDRRSIDNLERLREMARTLTDAEQSLTVRAFVRWLQGQLLGGSDEPDAADDGGGGGDGGPPRHVRLMTVHKAKGMEFPIVILPEVHAPVVTGGGGPDPRFVVGDFGLDLDLNLSGGRRTASPAFINRTRLDDDAQRLEAMRVFYVAVTRARNAVVFVGDSGGGNGRGLANARPPSDRKYAWRDEIAAAWPTLESLGAVYRPPGGGSARPGPVVVQGGKD